MGPGLRLRRALALSEGRDEGFEGLVLVPHAQLAQEREIALRQERAPLDGLVTTLGGAHVRGEAVLLPDPHLADPELVVDVELVETAARLDDLDGEVGALS